jgi:glycosyltransferase involved in cell wall biosynthesis
MSEPLRIMHVIDSLALGGAERVALNHFHGLNEHGQRTWLCATRREGPLKDLIRSPEYYHFLGKKHAVDLLAFLRLIRYIRNNRIQILHAHSSSLVWAIAAKWMASVPVVWHNHNGGSLLLPGRIQFILAFLCRWADHVISVNQPLVEWTVSVIGLPPSKVTYLPNFPDLAFPASVPKREQSNKVPIIICVANLRFPKDHSILVAALEILVKEGHDFKTWLVGKDFHDHYSTALKEQILLAGLGEKVQLLGERTDISGLLQQADIGVLSSASEGFPVAILEYGLASLAIVSTDVGECSAVLGDDGIIVAPSDAWALAKGLLTLLKNPSLRTILGTQFSDKVRELYSSEAVLGHLLHVYAGIKLDIKS